MTLAQELMGITPAVAGRGRLVRFHMPEDWETVAEAKKKQAAERDARIEQAFRLWMHDVPAREIAAGLGITVQCANRWISAGCRRHGVRRYR